MSLATILSISALVGAVILVMQNAWRLVAFLAIAVAGVEVLMAFKVLSLNLRGLPIPLILGASLAVLGVLLVTKVTRRVAVAAATVVAFVGVIQVLTALKIG